MQAKGGIAIIVVLLLIGAGFFFMQDKATVTPTEDAPVAMTGIEPPAADAADAAATETAEVQPDSEPQPWNATAPALEPAAGEAAAAEATPEAAPEIVEAEAAATTAETTEEAAPVAAEAEVIPAPAAEEESGSLLAAPKSLEVDVPDAMLDRVLGNLDAPITIIEYASMTCPHCANFHTTMLPDIKRELLATGKAKLIFRDYPLDKYALMASMMARCAPEGKYFDLIEVIFRNQERWMKSDNPTKALAQLGNLAGMDNDYIAACMQNAELQSAILAEQQEAGRLYQVRSTPSFIFNTQKNDNVKSLSGVETAKEINDAANKLLNMR